MKLLRFFDYAFTRTATFFFKRDGVEADRAIWFVTGIQTFLVLDAACTFLYFVFPGFLKEHSTFVAIAWGMILSGAYMLNRRRYRGQYFRFKEQWQESHRQRVGRGVAMIVIGIIVFYYPLFLLTLFGKASLS